MRILGLDYGSRTVGVAVSDPLLVTAQGVEIIRRESENKLRRTYARIEEIIASYGDVTAIVLGYPKNMNNTIGERAAKTEEFAAALERRCSLPVILWDERLSTVAAEAAMTESGIRGSERKKYVDEIAAMLILQGYLEYLKNRQEGDASDGT
ncbi:MAG: Holliday junction resolvase RuvX [Lachnospiraceae bacterium]|nr:Holliday junction resolvase RuvX [Lachnospiraceae bacterium]